jgi:hypothetical protein
VALKRYPSLMRASGLIPATRNLRKSRPMAARTTRKMPSVTVQKMYAPSFLRSVVAIMYMSAVEKERAKVA